MAITRLAAKRLAESQRKGVAGDEENTADVDHQQTESPATSKASPEPDTPKHILSPKDLAVRTKLPSRAKVWAFRKEIDAYTDLRRADVENPQMDHVIEVQLVENAMADTLSAAAGRPTLREQSVLVGRLREAFNAQENANVTSRTINLRKRGPHTAAMNRLQNDRGLRDITLEQLARQGKARDLVDDGTWHKIERTIVKAWDNTSERLDATGTASSRADVHLAQVTETLHGYFERLGLMDSAASR